MSGRLTILPKKTYCPWKPENVERVLRDERLERERQQAVTARSLGDADDTRRQRRRYEDGGHVNLFPEAKEAELRTIAGGGDRGDEKKSASSSAEILPPAPLGGDEAARRKSGNIPFYMRQFSDGRGKYDNLNGSSFRLGDNRANGTRGDEITGKIMKDQFERREDDRKDKLDPMSRFYVDHPNPTNSAADGTSTNTSATPIMEYCHGVAYSSKNEIRKKGIDGVSRRRDLSRDERRSRHKKLKSNRSLNHASSLESDNTRSSSSYSSSPKRVDNTDNTRKHSSRSRRHKSHRHREGSPSRYEEERHDRRKGSSRGGSRHGSSSRRHCHRNEQYSHRRKDDKNELDERRK